MSHTTEAVIRAKVQPVGDAAGDFQKAAAAAKDLGAAVNQTNKQLKQTQTAAQEATADIQKMMRAKDVAAERARQLAAMGLDGAGRPLVTADMARTGRYGGEVLGDLRAQARQNVQAALRQNAVQEQTRRQFLAMGLDESGRPLKSPVRQVGEQAANMLGFGGVTSAAGPGMALAGVAAAAVATVAALHKFGDVAIKVSDALHDKYATARERERAVVESLDPTGLSGKDYRLGQSLAGLPFKQQESALGHAATMAQMGVGQEAYGGYAARRMERSSAKAMADATRRHRYEAMPQIDRSTAGGEIAYREAQQRLEAQHDVTRARREFSAASASHAEALAMKREADAVTARMRERLERAREKTPWGGPGWDAPNKPQGQGPGQFAKDFGRGMVHGLAYIGDVAKGAHEMPEVLAEQRARQQYAQAAQEYANALQRSQKAQDQVTEEAKKLAAADKQLTQTEQNAARVELNILRQRESAAAGTSANLGMMGRGERMRGLAAARWIREHGIDAATPDIIQGAAAFDPEFMRKRAENFGQNTDEFKAWKKEAGAEAGLGFQAGPLGEIRGSIDQIQNKVTEGMQGMDERFADAMAGAITTNLRMFMDMLDKRLSSALDVMRSQWSMNKGSQ